MKSIHTIFILSLITLSMQTNALNCPIVKCADPKKVKSKETCFSNILKDEVKTYSYGRCPRGEKCPINGQLIDEEKKCIKDEDLVRKELVDSEVCFKNEDCASNKCYDNACIGLEKEAECKKTNQCGIKLFCSAKLKCQTQIAPGAEEECRENYDCQNNAGCFKKKCVQYYSIELGQDTPGSDYCKSGFANGTPDALKCVEIQRVEPMECQPEQTQCNYTPTLGEAFTKQCLCSYAFPDKKFCPLDSHDEIMKEYLETVIKYYDEETFEYHSEQRHLSTNPNMRAYIHEIYNFPLLYKADECAIEFSMNSSMSKLTTFLMLIGLFLF